MTDEPTTPQGQPCALALADAAYVLGSLSPAERLEFERHLPTCATCRRSVGDLAGLPGLLGRLPVQEVTSPVPVEPLPSTVLPALVARVRREHRRKVVVLTLGAAAAVAAGAVGVHALQSMGEDDTTHVATPPSTSQTLAKLRAMDVVVDYGVTADVALSEVKWGTKIDISCRYEDGGEDDGGLAYVYKLVAITNSGNVVDVASWEAAPGDTYVNDPITGTKLRQITRVEVRNARGQTILRIDL